MINITENIDFLSDAGLKLVLDTIRNSPRVVLFVSLPCTSGCRFNVDINNKLAVCEKRMRHNERLFNQLWNQFAYVCRLVDYKIPIVLEWPRHNLLWKIPRVTTL